MTDKTNEQILDNDLGIILSNRIISQYGEAKLILLELRRHLDNTHPSVEAMTMVCRGILDATAALGDTNYRNIRLKREEAVEHEKT